jgi:CspA family cold shock protein
MAKPGTVKWFSDTKGYGFIQQPTGPDVYVHHSAIQMDGYKTLKPGMAVRFETREGPVGLEARVVSPLGPSDSPPSPFD